MIKTLDMLDVLINDSNFNLMHEFELVREFEELNEDLIGGDTVKECEVVIGDAAENTKVAGMMVKKLKNYDNAETIQNTKICDQKADAVYALTNMIGETYYFLVWYIVN